MSTTQYTDSGVGKVTDFEVAERAIRKAFRWCCCEPNADQQGCAADCPRKQALAGLQRGRELLLVRKEGKVPLMHELSSEEVIKYSSLIVTTGPWALLPYWDIVGMNHYHVEGVRYLFVSMARNGRLVKHEGREDGRFWDELVRKANIVNEELKR